MTAGRTDVTRRALERAIAATAATVLGVPGREVAVRLSDDRGDLLVDIDAAVRLGREPGLVARSTAWRTELAARAGDVTGHRISRVRLHLTTVSSEKKGRVG